MSVVRNFDDPIVPFEGEMDTKILNRFMLENAIPSVFEFSEVYLDNFLKQGNDTAILFYKEKDSPLVKAFREAAKSFKRDLLFTTSALHT